LLPRLIGQQNGAVSAEEIDRFLDALEEPKRTTLARLRQTILEILPEADQGVSYGVPAFKVGGKTIAGFAVVGGVWHQRRSGRRLAITVEPPQSAGTRACTSVTVLGAPEDVCGLSRRGRAG
jgi:hypothetical protein